MLIGLEVLTLKRRHRTLKRTAKQNIRASSIFHKHSKLLMRMVRSKARISSWACKIIINSSHTWSMLKWRTNHLAIAPWDFSIKVSRLRMLKRAHHLTKATYSKCRSRPHTSQKRRPVRSWVMRRTVRKLATASTCQLRWLHNADKCLAGISTVVQRT